MKLIEFVQKMFRDYYTRDYSLDSFLSMIEKREFGFISFEGWMLRHKSFKHIDDLKEFLQSTVPSDAFCSCAYYEDPEAEMDKKGWLGADLIFDIDADHIPTPCNKVHDKWICSVCGFAGKGFTPNKCPVCSGEKFEVSTWPCQVCLDSAKAETVRVLDMLMRDFGFSEKEVRVFFSGHRGYHIYVESEAIETLGAVARREIVDYVYGLGLDRFFHGLDEKSWKAINAYKDVDLDYGWCKHMARGVKNFIRNSKEQDLMNIGLRKNVAKAILQNKDAILKGWMGMGTWSVIKGISLETWRKIAEHSVKLQSAKIDTVVTTDIHRLIRLADTLHGKTGFKKVEFPVSAIDAFDPFKSAITFKKGTTTIFVHDAPEFRLNDEMFGPYKNQKVELPTAAAMLLVCKGRAEVAE